MIRYLLSHHASDSAKLHQNGMPDDFLASFGETFMFLLHKQLIRCPSVIALGNFDRNILTGIIFGSVNIKKTFLEFISINSILFLPFILKKIVLKPRILIRVFQAILYPHLNKPENTHAEILILSVSDKQRHKGIGTLLVNNLKQQYKSKGINQFKVSTKKDNYAANKFYKKAGGYYVSEKLIFDTVWNNYLFKI